MRDRPISNSVVSVVSLCSILAYLAIIAVVAFSVLTAKSARAHSFYPWEYCHDQDCWPMGKGEREPDPVLTPQGWRLHDGEIVAFAEARPPPDGRFHVCRRGGAAEGAVIRPGRPCLWVPAQGS